MSSELDKKLTAGGKSRKYIKTDNTSCASSALIRAFRKRYQHAGFAVALGYLGGNYADDTVMPVVTRYHEHIALGGMTVPRKKSLGFL